MEKKKKVVHKQNLLFSKPVQPSPPSTCRTTQSGRKQTLNPKLAYESYVHAGAVKQRKLEQAKSGNSTSSESHVNTQPRNTTLLAKKAKASVCRSSCMDEKNDQTRPDCNQLGPIYKQLVVTGCNRSFIT